MNSSSEFTIPSELVLLVVSFGDPQTLARCARLSFELFKFASPLLYKKVTVRRAEDYGYLFCQRVSPLSVYESVAEPLARDRIAVASHPAHLHFSRLELTFSIVPPCQNPYTSSSRLHPFLSLNQIQHLHLHVAADAPPLMSVSRLETSPLRLKSLEITYHTPRPFGRHHDIYSQLLPSTLVVSSDLPSDAPNTARTLSLISVERDAAASMLRSWRTVPSLVLIGTSPVSWQGENVFRWANDGLDPNDAKGMKVVLDLRTSDFGRSMQRLEMFAFAHGMAGSPVGGRAWKSQAVVGSEACAAAVRAGLARAGAKEEERPLVEVVVDQRQRRPMEDE